MGTNQTIALNSFEDQNAMVSIDSNSEETANILTHSLGFLLSVSGTAYLMTIVRQASTPEILACGLYSATLVLTYAASTLSHVIRHINWRKGFRTLDQISIFLLIAGTYTP